MLIETFKFRSERTLRLSAKRFLFLLFCLLVAKSAYGLNPTAGLAQFDDLDLSRDGNHLLMVRAQENAYALVVRDLATNSDLTLYQGSHETGLINWCRWANDTRIVCSLRFYQSIPRMGFVAATRMFAINIDGTERLELVRPARNRLGSPPVWNAQVQDRVVNWLGDDPSHILVQINRDHPNRPSVYRLNIYDNDLIRTQRPRRLVRRWYASHEGTVRLAIGYRYDETPVLYHVVGRRLVPLSGNGFKSEIPPQPVGFTTDGKDAFISMTNGQDRHAIYRLNLETGELTEEVFRHPGYDIFGGLFQHPKTGEPLGVGYTDHHPNFEWFDDEMERLVNHIEDELPGKYFRLLATDAAYKKMLVYTYGGISPRYYIYNLETDSLDLVGHSYPQLKDEAVVDLAPMQYTSRDGTKIPAYVATPQGPPPYATVLLPHGGPYARDSAEFDPWTQFLVDAGYAVLKPNYRGSVGYGEAFMQAGYRQWGLKMQEDLIDGLYSLVDQGLADPDRVCMVGASYGGYSALVSTFKFNEQIKCAVSMAGIADLKKMVERTAFFDLKKRNRERIQSSKNLAANSPLAQVQDIDTPILLVHGVQDTVVRVRQSRRLANALAQHGKNFRYVEQPIGDHFLSYKSQREQLFGEMDSFLAEHLKP
ncbi:MAG: prolyl oligopeptidase family serine peptidase [Pseudomonadales bacterium]|nr:prolyl oligopeptidase family serine peptidase [Pseudomonadales bacterium]